MDPFFWADLGTTLFNSLVQAATVFLFATGLSLILGILNILNFAHGAYFMMGAYLAFSLLQWFGDSYGIAAFVLVAVIVGFIVAAIGFVMERVLFRRLQGIDYHYSLIGTYALLLATEGAVKAIWGVKFLAVPVPAEVGGALQFGDIIMPSLSLFVIALGFVFFFILNQFLHHTRSGKLVQSIAIDPWMANALGVNVPLVYCLIVVVSFGLAGLAGALLSPTQALTPGLATGLALPAFGVLIVGGMGNIKGTFVASLALCTIDTFGSTYLGQTQGIIFFVAVCAILLVRPQGLYTGAHV